MLLRWGLQHGSAVIPRSGSEEHQKVCIACPHPALPAAAACRHLLASLAEGACAVCCGLWLMLKRVCCCLPVLVLWCRAWRAYRCSVHCSCFTPDDGLCGVQDLLGCVEFELPEEDFKYISNIDFQLKYFVGNGLAIGDDKPYHTYQELWDEEPNKTQIEMDYS